MKKTASQIADEVLAKVAMTEEEAERAKEMFARSLGIATGLSNLFILPRTLPKSMPLLQKVVGTGMGSLIGGGVGYGLGRLHGKIFPPNLAEDPPWYAESDEAARRAYIGSGIGGGLGMVAGEQVYPKWGIGSSVGGSAGAALGGQVAKSTLPE